MPDDNVVKMVDSLAADDNVAAQSAFKDALASKIGIGDMLEVQILLKSYNAKVVSDPIYDPENQLLLN